MCKQLCENMHISLKKVPELEVDVDLIYQTPIPAPFSEDEVLRLLNKIKSSARGDPLTLQVTKKKIKIRRILSKKPIATIHRMSLSNLNLPPESNCMMLIRKVKRKLHELLVIRFVNCESLEEFRQIISITYHRKGTTKTTQMQNESITPRKEVDKNAVLPSQSATSAYQRRQMALRGESIHRRTQSESRQRRGYGSNPEVYVVKRVKCDEGKELNYSRVTIYDLNPEDFSEDSDDSSPSNGKRAF